MHHASTVVLYITSAFVDLAEQAAHGKPKAFENRSPSPSAHNHHPFLCLLLPWPSPVVAVVVKGKNIVVSSS
jgi:hypothetical protein